MSKLYYYKMLKFDKNNEREYGILMAVSFNDARKWLGKNAVIKRVSKKEQETLPWESSLRQNIARKYFQMRGVK